MNANVPTAASSNASQQLLKGVPTDLWIGGRWRAAADGARFDVEDPATERAVACVASATVEDCISALDAAQAAGAGWAAKTPRERGEILRRAFELMVRDAERLARIITLENGKGLADARAEIAYAAEFFRWNSEEAVRIIGQASRAPSSGARILVTHKPAGIALLVTPWNFPAAMATRKIGPALAAGCTVVVKPATATPLTMLALMPLLQEAGVPAGVVNLVPSQASGKVVSAMLRDGRVRVISFTGSTEVGRTLLKEAAENIVRPAMELGGNAPFIVCQDADLDEAVEGAMIAKMRNIGEACTAANRFYVHESVAEEFARKLATRMSALKMGNGLEEGVTVGPLVNAATRDKVHALVQDARQRGARVITGGEPVPGKGYFYPATVLTQVSADAQLVREEIFGPVAAIQSFAKEEDMLRAANASEHGLASYVYTRDLRRGLAIAEKLEAGMVGLNRGMVSDPAAPFGGVKHSGIGREGGHEGLFEYLDTQYVSVSW
jgi:succinate-semialdehyde dehydrogenase/glutarate-semialdehyde dehydrogenase